MTRSITTAAELDALPVGAGFVDKHGDLGLVDERDGVRGIQYAETEFLKLSWCSRYLPATVVHEPRGAYTAAAPVAVPVASDAAVEAAARAIHAEGWTCEAHEPKGLDECEQCATSTPRLARAVLSAALPLLGAAPSATREDVEAEVARLLAERTAAHADDATCASCTHEYVEDLEKRVEEGDAKVERQRDRLRAREEQVRRLRAEVTRLHALVADLRAARPAPVWDEDTVTEAAAQRGFDVAAAKHGSDRYTDEQRNWATISEDEREMVRTMITAALAVVREHLPVRPDRETIARAFFDAGAKAAAEEFGLDEPVRWDSLSAADVERLLAQADAVLALWPGASRATVQAEALRDAADEAEAVDADALVAGCAAPVSGEHGRQSVIDAARAMCEEPWTWLRARADRLCPKGADRG